MHSGQKGVDNLAKTLKENVIEGLMVLVKQWQQLQWKTISMIFQETQEILIPYMKILLEWPSLKKCYFSEHNFWHVKG